MSQLHPCQHDSMLSGRLIVQMKGPWRAKPGLRSLSMILSHIYNSWPGTETCTREDHEAS